MIEAPLYSAKGVKRDAGFALPEALFDGTVNEAVLHLAVKTFLGNQRQGTHKVKRRQEVSGGNQKPWKQKGTGRARQGTTRAPHWRGGGIVFGPAPRDYRAEIPKKVRQLARRSALNARAREGQLTVIEPIDMTTPHTRTLFDLIQKLSLGDTRTLILTDGTKPAVHMSGRNMAGVTVMPFAEATAYDILHALALVVERSALETGNGETAAEGEAAAPKKVAKKAAKKPAAAKAKAEKPTAKKAAAKKASPKTAAKKKPAADKEANDG
jgi:large subunit ribosomal protein L4